MNDLINNGSDFRIGFGFGHCSPGILALEQAFAWIAELLHSGRSGVIVLPRLAG